MRIGATWLLFLVLVTLCFDFKLLKKKNKEVWVQKSSKSIEKLAVHEQM